MSFDIIKELESRIKELEDDFQELSNKFLNIHFNSTLFLKIMKLEQREIGRNQEIERLKMRVKKLEVPL